MVVNTSKVQPHKHCIVCGKSIDDSDSFCDELCQSKYKSAQKRQQMLFMLFVVLMLLILFMPMILSFIYGPKS
jgi:predicted nucleic acid-binding Zn ribbon protein